MKKLGLALGAGGSRGVAHVGFLQALEEEGIRASCVAGCSMGAIVGACYCLGVPMKKLHAQIGTLKLSQITALNVNPLRASGLCRFTKARKLLEKYIPSDTTFSDLKIPFLCVATDLLSGKTVELKHGNLTDAILASSCIPGVFSPQALDGKLLVDGGVLERVPTRSLRRMGAEVIVAVDVLGNLPAQGDAPTNLIETLLRYIDVIDTRITQRNQYMRRKRIDLWLEPQLGDMSQYRVKNLSFAYRQGYDTGKANAEKIRALLEEGSAGETEDER